MQFQFGQYMLFPVFFCPALSMLYETSSTIIVLHDSAKILIFSLRWSLYKKYCAGTQFTQKNSILQLHTSSLEYSYVTYCPQVTEQESLGVGTR
jgi:hypothetical protein